MSELNGSGHVPEDAIFLTAAFLDEKTTQEVVLPILSEKTGTTVKVKIRTVSFGDIASEMPNMQPGNSESSPLVDPEAWEAWGNKIISRSMINPVMSESEVDRLNDDRTLIVNAILDLNGFTKKEEEKEGEARQDTNFRDEGVPDHSGEDSPAGESDTSTSGPDNVTGSDVQHDGVGVDSAVGCAEVGEPST